MWADFFVSADGACRGGGAVDGNVFCRGGSVCNVCCAFWPSVSAVSAVSAMPAMPVKHTLRPITIFNKP